MNKKNLFRENAILRTLLISFVTSLVGLFLLVLSEVIKTPIVASIIRDLASLFIGSMILSIVWEFYSKRSLMAELYSTNTISFDVGKTGILGVKDKWNGIIDWANELNQTNNLFIFFIYGSTWTKTNIASLSAFAKRPGTKAMFVFPNYENEELMNSIGLRLETEDGRPTANDIKLKIEDSIKEIRAIFKESHMECLKIYKVDVIPVYSYYEMDKKVIIAFYKHKKRRDDVPHIVINKSGTLFEYFSSDIKEMLGDPLSNRTEVYPN